jgi:hypothetical protein
MLLAWKARGIITLAGYILGFPTDTPETIRRDIAIIQEELPLDIIEFFCLTPLPSRRTIGFSGKRASRRLRTSTGTMSSMSAPAISA